MKNYLIFTLLNTISLFTNGQGFTGDRSMELRILTDQKEYQFRSANMDARLNDVLERFEFVITFNSIKSMKDSSDLNFLQNCLKGNDIIINASLPDDKSPDLDLSYFKGNKSIDLAGEIKMGATIFGNNLDFNGMLINGDQGLVFNFNVFLNERGLAFMKVGTEKILEIEITARGDKINGLTTVK